MPVLAPWHIRWKNWSCSKNGYAKEPTQVNLAKGEPGVLNRLLNAIAVMQPVLMRDENFTGALATLTGRPFDELLPYIRSLEDAGVLIRRGQAIRIVPDLLGDVILAEACYDQTSPGMVYKSRQ